MSARSRLPRLRGPALALLAGAAIGLAHPPFGFLPGLLGLAVLLWQIDGADAARPLRSAFLRGWLAGFAYFVVGTWWVGEAFFVDAAAHGWQAPFAVTLLPAGLGLFWGAAAAGYRLIAPRNSSRALVFAAVLSLAEWLRGHVLSGFPWDLIGEAWRAGSAPSQGAALVGAYGMTFITIAILAAPGAAVSARPKARA
ncbi:MAG: apolipoprotein N-acyltransferase, partial [Caulobacteraceae bacterium]